jgi:cytoskeletal protein CcmA (bactofilin family)
MLRKQLRKSLGFQMPRKASATSDASVLIVGPDQAGIDGVDFDGTVQIDGCVEGDVRCRRLVVTPGGRVDGAVSARTVHLDGTVNGPIDAERVFLGPTAVVKGNVDYDALNVATGASISGMCRDRSRTHPRRSDTEMPVCPPPRALDLVWTPCRKALPAMIPPTPTIAGSGAKSMKAVWETCQRAADVAASPLRFSSMRPRHQATELAALLKLQRGIS